MGSLLGKYIRINKRKEKQGDQQHHSGSGLKRLGESLATRKFSWEKRGHTNTTKEHRFENITDESCIKLPNSVQGNQFAIHKCKNSKLFIYDNSDSVFIDKCSNCTIFVAPTKNTIYVRNCENCKIMAASHQFRMRDCKNIDIWLFTLTRPAIESVDNINFACFCYNYKGLSEQFQAAKLNPFNNSWSDVHDFDFNERNCCQSWHIMSSERAKIELGNFIPPKDIKQLVQEICIANNRSNSETPSFSQSDSVNPSTELRSQPLICKEIPQKIILKSLGGSFEDFLNTISINKEESLVLSTKGLPMCELSRENGAADRQVVDGKNFQHCLVVFFWDGQIDERAKIFISAMEQRYPECLLIQTRQLDISQNDSQRIFGSSHYERTIAAGPVLGLHYYGDTAISKCTNTLKCMVTGTPGLVFVSSNPQIVQQQLINYFRYNEANMS